MKYLLGILLVISSFNVANAACSSYTGLAALTEPYSNPISNIVVEGYKVGPTDHSIFMYIASLDYEGSSYTCKTLSYSDNSLARSDYHRDEFLKALKLGMTLGYKLSIAQAYSDGGFLRLIALENITITKP